MGSGLAQLLEEKYRFTVETQGLHYTAHRKPVVLYDDEKAWSDEDRDRDDARVKRNSPLAQRVAAQLTQVLQEGRSGKTFTVDSLENALTRSLQGSVDAAGLDVARDYVRQVLCQLYGEDGALDSQAPPGPVQTPEAATKPVAATTIGAAYPHAEAADGDRPQTKAPTFPGHVQRPQPAAEQHAASLPRQLGAPPWTATGSAQQRLVQPGTGAAAAGDDAEWPRPRPHHGRIKEQLSFLQNADQLAAIISVATTAATTAAAAAVKNTMQTPPPLPPGAFARMHAAGYGMQSVIPAAVMQPPPFLADRGGAAAVRPVSGGGVGPDADSPDPQPQQRPSALGYPHRRATPMAVAHHLDPRPGVMGPRRTWELRNQTSADEAPLQPQPEEPLTQGLVTPLGAAQRDVGSATASATPGAGGINGGAGSSNLRAVRLGAPRVTARTPAPARPPIVLSEEAGGTVADGAGDAAAGVQPWPAGDAPARRQQYGAIRQHESNASRHAGPAAVLEGAPQQPPLPGVDWNGRPEARSGAQPHQQHLPARSGLSNAVGGQVPAEGVFVTGGQSVLSWAAAAAGQQALAARMAAAGVSAPGVGNGAMKAAAAAAPLPPRRPALPDDMQDAFRNTLAFIANSDGARAPRHQPLTWEAMEDVETRKEAQREAEELLGGAFDYAAAKSLLERASGSSRLLQQAGGETGKQSSAAPRPAATQALPSAVSGLYGGRAEQQGPGPKAGLQLAVAGTADKGPQQPRGDFAGLLPPPHSVWDVDEAWFDLNEFTKAVEAEVSYRAAAAAGAGSQPVWTLTGADATGGRVAPSAKVTATASRPANTTHGRDQANQSVQARRAATTGQAAGPAGSTGASGADRTAGGAATRKRTPSPGPGDATTAPPAGSPPSPPRLTRRTQPMGTVRIAFGQRVKDPPNTSEGGGTRARGSSPRGTDGRGSPRAAHKRKAKATALAPGAGPTATTVRSSDDDEALSSLASDIASLMMGGDEDLDVDVDGELGECHQSPAQEAALAPAVAPAAAAVSPDTGAHGGSEGTQEEARGQQQLGGHVPSTAHLGDEGRNEQGPGSLSFRGQAGARDRDPLAGGAVAGPSSSPSPPPTAADSSALHALPAQLPEIPTIALSSAEAPSSWLQPGPAHPQAWPPTTATTRPQFQYVVDTAHPPLTLPAWASSVARADGAPAMYAAALGDARGGMGASTPPWRRPHPRASPAAAPAIQQDTLSFQDTQQQQPRQVVSAFPLPTGQGSSTSIVPSQQTAAEPKASRAAGASTAGRERQPAPDGAAELGQATLQALEDELVSRLATLRLAAVSRAPASLPAQMPGMVPPLVDLELSRTLVCDVLRENLWSLLANQQQHHQHDKSVAAGGPEGEEALSLEEVVAALGLAPVSQTGLHPDWLGQQGQGQAQPLTSQMGHTAASEQNSQLPTLRSWEGRSFARGASGAEEGAAPADTAVTASHVSAHHAQTDASRDGNAGSGHGEAYPPLEQQASCASVEVTLSMGTEPAAATFSEITAVGAAAPALQMPSSIMSVAATSELSLAGAQGLGRPVSELPNRERPGAARQLLQAPQGVPHRPSHPVSSSAPVAVQQREASAPAHHQPGPDERTVQTRAVQAHAVQARGVQASGVVDGRGVQAFGVVEGRGVQAHAMQARGTQASGVQERATQAAGVMDNSSQADPPPPHYLVQAALAAGLSYGAGPSMPASSSVPSAASLLQLVLGPDGAPMAMPRSYFMVPSDGLPPLASTLGPYGANGVVPPPAGGHAAGGGRVPFSLPGLSKLRDSTDVDSSTDSIGYRLQGPGARARAAMLEAQVAAMRLARGSMDSEGGDDDDVLQRSCAQLDLASLTARPVRLDQHRVSTASEIAWPRQDALRQQEQQQQQLYAGVGAGAGAAAVGSDAGASSHAAGAAGDSALAASVGLQGYRAWPSKQGSGPDDGGTYLTEAFRLQGSVAHISSGAGRGPVAVQDTGSGLAPSRQQSITSATAPDTTARFTTASVASVASASSSIDSKGALSLARSSTVAGSRHTQPAPFEGDARAQEGANEDAGAGFGSAAARHRPADLQASLSSSISGDAGSVATPMTAADGASVKAANHSPAGSDHTPLASAPAVVANAGAQAAIAGAGGSPVKAAGAAGITATPRSAEAATPAVGDDELVADDVPTDDYDEDPDQILPFDFDSAEDDSYTAQLGLDTGIEPEEGESPATPRSTSRHSATQLSLSEEREPATDEVTQLRGDGEGPGAADSTPRQLRYASAGDESSESVSQRAAGAYAQAGDRLSDDAEGDADAEGEEVDPSYLEDEVLDEVEVRRVLDEEDGAWTEDGEGHGGDYGPGTLEGHGPGIAGAAEGGPDPAGSSGKGAGSAGMGEELGSQGRAGRAGSSGGKEVEEEVPRRKGSAADAAGSAGAPAVPSAGTSRAASVTSSAAAQRTTQDAERLPSDGRVTSGSGGSVDHDGSAAARPSHASSSSVGRVPPDVAVESAHAPPRQPGGVYLTQAGPARQRVLSTTQQPGTASLGSRTLQEPSSPGKPPSLADYQGPTGRLWRPQPAQHPRDPLSSSSETLMASSEASEPALDSLTRALRDGERRRVGQTSSLALAAARAQAFGLGHGLPQTSLDVSESTDTLSESVTSSVYSVGGMTLPRQQPGVPSSGAAAAAEASLGGVLQRRRGGPQERDGEYDDEGSEGELSGREGLAPLRVGFAMGAVAGGGALGPGRGSSRREGTVFRLRQYREQRRKLMQQIGVTNGSLLLSSATSLSTDSSTGSGSDGEGDSP